MNDKTYNHTLLQYLSNGSEIGKHIQWENSLNGHLPNSILLCLVVMESKNQISSQNLNEKLLNYTPNLSYEVDCNIKLDSFLNVGNST